MGFLPCLVLYLLSALRFYALLFSECLCVYPASVGLGFVGSGRCVLLSGARGLDTIFVCFSRCCDH